MVEGMGWLRKLRRRKERDALAAKLIDALYANNLPYFLFPLQLDSDAQIRLHSPFVGMAEAIKIVLESFARHAAPETRIVVKEHPLDNGVRDWELICRDLAQRFGVADRVDYLPSGDIVPIAQRSLGMVTINSTSGTLGLSMGIPAVVLGTAIYDIPDVTWQGGIDSFWQTPCPPDMETFAAFRRVLIDRCLIPGGFFSDRGLEMVVRCATARFMNAVPQDATSL